MKRKGRPEKIKPSDLSLLHELALQQLLATLDELVKAFQSHLTTGLVPRNIGNRLHRIAEALGRRAYTHAWKARARRLVIRHDRLTKVSEAWVLLAEARMLACRLTG